MPECGEPGPILETARQLAGWYRPEQVPYPIVCTGIRPGERLHEVLLSPNESLSAEQVARGVRAVNTSRPLSLLSRIDSIVDDLEQLAADGDREALAHTCIEAAMELQ
jgi:FlaA1/EpsC-like NDP-sugar epimerase